MSEGGTPEWAGAPAVGAMEARAAAFSAGSARLPRPPAPSATVSRPGRPGDLDGGERRSAPRRASLALRRVDPRSVFQVALFTSVLLAVVLLVAAAALYALLAGAGVISAVNHLFAEFTRDPSSGTEPAPLLTASRVLIATGLVAALDVLLLTLLATVAAAVYNVVASFTGGIDVVLTERD